MPNGLGGGLRPERRSTGQHLVHHRAKTIYVHTTANRVLLALCLFRSHVARRSKRCTAVSEPRVVLYPPGESEVGDLWGTVSRKQDVCRLQISVDDSTLVGCVDGLSHRGKEHGGLTACQGRSGKLLGKAPTFDIFHGEVRPAIEVADRVDLYDVAVPKGRLRLGPAQETFQFLRPSMWSSQEHLQCDVSLETMIPGFVHDAHAAAADHFLNVKTGDRWQFERWRLES